MRRVHHSAATLARWKIGAEAWSKAHHGKVYAGIPPAATGPLRTPIPCMCTEIATVNSGDLPLLSFEAVPKLPANAFMTAFSTGAGEQDSMSPTKVADLEFNSVNSWTSSAYNSSTAGWSQGEMFGGPSAPSLPFAFPSPRSRRLLAPHHAPQELSFYEQPLPPTPVPTPEPAEIILLSTALVALAVGVKFGMVKLERPARI